MLTLAKLSIGFRRYRGLLRQETITQLSDLSLDLPPGEVLALIGGSGAGKSLLAHALLGLLPPNAWVTGQMRFEGIALTGAYPPGLRGRQIALMPQEIGHLDPLAPIGRQLAWAMHRVGATGDPEARLAAMDLRPDVARLYPAQLSGGMARRVLLAMALAGQPRLLIADEPTVGLDPANRDRVLGLLQAHAARGAAVLLITHDVMAALPFVDRVAVLAEGRLCGIENASHFCGNGAALGHAEAKALWHALPQNGFTAHA